MSNCTSSATLYQYSRAGTQLSSVNVTGTYDGYLIGAEFNEVATVTPEPAALALLATGLLGVFGFTRRSRKA